jgi:hypothetical protein
MVPFNHWLPSLLLVANQSLSVLLLWSPEALPQVRAAIISPDMHNESADVANEINGTNFSRIGLSHPNPTKAFILRF